MKLMLALKIASGLGDFKMVFALKIASDLGDFKMVLVQMIILILNVQYYDLIIIEVGN